MKRYLITQIYFTHDEARNAELRKVIEHHKYNAFDKIYYLNEKIYGIESDKIEEVVVSKRLKFNDVFAFVKEKQLDGVIVFANSDIYFNETLNNISKKIDTIPIMYCQLRIDEFPDGKLELNVINPNYVNGWSQDAWIYHTNFNHLLIDSSDFYFGRLHCDPKFAYIAKERGFQVFNTPREIQCIHLHNVTFRTERIELPGNRLNVKPRSILL